MTPRCSSGARYFLAIYYLLATCDIFFPAHRRPRRLGTAEEKALAIVTAQVDANLHLFGRLDPLRDEPDAQVGTDPNEGTHQLLTRKSQVNITDQCLVQ